MRAFLIVLSLGWITVGVMLTIYTGWTRDFLERLYSGIRARLLAALPIGIGIILVAGAFSQGEKFWVFFLVGSMALAKGCYLALAPADHVKAVLEWWLAREQILRWSGLFTFGLGLSILVYLTGS